jgi:hypothetical protein
MDQYLPTAACTRYRGVVVLQTVVVPTDSPLVPANIYTSLVPLRLYRAGPHHQRAYPADCIVLQPPRDLTVLPQHIDWVTTQFPTRFALWRRAIRLQIVPTGRAL